MDIQRCPCCDYRIHSGQKLFGKQKRNKNKSVHFMHIGFVCHTKPKSDHPVAQCNVQNSKEQKLLFVRGSI